MELDLVGKILDGSFCEEGQACRCSTEPVLCGKRAVSERAERPAAVRVDESPADERSSER